jgi:hypothetical protein
VAYELVRRRTPHGTWLRMPRCITSTEDNMRECAFEIMRAMSFIARMEAQQKLPMHIDSLDGLRIYYGKSQHVRCRALESRAGPSTFKGRTDQHRTNQHRTEHVKICHIHITSRAYSKAENVPMNKVKMEDVAIIT